MKINLNPVAAFVFAAMCTQTAMAAESAEALYRQCEAKSMAGQHDCFPAVEKQSEVKLIAAEEKARAGLAELENESEGSRAMHPVKVFDKVVHAYRAFRTAESNRVLSSYGSGNGGGLASYRESIELNLSRIRELKDE